MSNPPAGHTWKFIKESKGIVSLMYLVSCNFYSDIPFRSYAVNRMGDCVPPTLSSSTQLDEGICVTIMALINISQYLIHTIIHPLHYWRSGRASTMRWCGLPTKSPLSVLAFDLSSKLHNKPSYLPMLHSSQAPKPLEDLYDILPSMYWSNYPNHCIYHHPGTN